MPVVCMSRNFASLTNLLCGAFLLACLSLVVYSYTQVDLNLTLSSNPTYLSLQSHLTELGYFNRPLSATLYALVIVCLFLIYFGLLHQAKNSQIQTGKLIKVALIGSIMLTLSYPAFSHDIFNYIFDVRILAEHGDNPYTMTALDYPEDDWTRFMHWTHRVYPYGPTWLLITLPVYLLGMGKFVLTLLSFKLMMFLSYWLTLWSIYKLSQKFQKQSTNLALALFAFNPLILIEGLVSPHLDMVMAAFMLYGIYLASREQKVLGWLSILFSVGIKYVSAAVVLPVWLWQKKYIRFETMISASIGLSYLLMFVVVSQRELLPWYVLVPFALTVLVVKKRFWVKLMLILSPALLARYFPFLYWGEYSAAVDMWRHGLMVGIGVAMFMVLNYKFLPRRQI